MTSSVMQNFVLRWGHIPPIADTSWDKVLYIGCSKSKELLGLPAVCLHICLRGPKRCRVEDEERLERPQLYESKRLAKALLSYLQRHHDLVGPLFDLLDIFTVRTRVDFSFLKDYYKTTVAQTYSLQEKRQACTMLCFCIIEPVASVVTGCNLDWEHSEGQSMN